MDKINLSDIPKNPGVYRFYDNNGVIYVGKAKNLKNRLSSYFQSGSQKTNKTNVMIKNAKNVEWIVVPSEIEALLLEYQWIKQYSPKYNIVFRDDKSYPYIAIDKRTIDGFDSVSKVYKTRRKSNDKLIEYFGPYPNEKAVNHLIEVVLTKYGFRNCTTNTYIKSKQNLKPCFFGEIKRCLAPCVNKNIIEEYENNIALIEDFLNGRNDNIIHTLIKEMECFSQKCLFEKSAKIRDYIKSLENIFSKPKNTSISNGDAHGVYYDNFGVTFYSISLRNGKIISTNESFTPDLIENEIDLSNILEKYIMKFYFLENIDITKNIYIPHTLNNTFDVQKILSKNANKKITIHTPMRGDILKTIKNLNDNAKLSHLRRQSNMFNDIKSRSAALTQISKYLSLNEPPIRIECYDISHTGGSLQVGSMVVFTDGIKDKKEYKIFNINTDTTTNNDDLSAISQVLERRLLHPDWKYPNLIVIDGGFLQVNAANSILQKLNIKNIGLCSLAKKMEEVYLPNNEYPIILPRDSLSLQLLQQIRDESHNFAIKNHRHRRNKNQTNSQLLKIKGIGSKRMKTLLKHFGSVKRIKEGSLDDFTGLLGNKTGEKIFNQIKLLDN